MEEENKLTGYPSIDKPWLKYYSREAIEAPLPEMTMYQYIWENNKDYLDDIALRYYGTKITYEKLFENIKKAATAFYSMGVRKADTVTIMSMHTPECIYSVYGLNYIGAIANMVYMTLSEKEIIDTIKHTESKLLLVLDPVLDKVNNIKDKIDIPIIVLGVSDSMPLYMKIGYKLKTKAGKHPFLTYNQFLSKGIKEPLMSDDHTAPAVIVYTSGTTGEPKGAVLSNDALNSHSFQMINANFNFKRKKTFLFVIPLFLAFGISHIHLAINTGIEASLHIDLQPNSLTDALFKVKPSFFATGPVYIDAVLEHAPGNLSNLELIAGGGGELSEESEIAFNKFMQKCGSKAIYANAYGLTETSSTLCASTNIINRRGSVGVPLPRTCVKVIDLQDGRELLYDQEGELCFRTPNMMSCYYNNKEATDELVFADESSTWIHTGDIGTVDKDGFVYIKGRLKRIYAVRTKDGVAVRLFPQRIEEFMESLDLVKSCAVVVEKNDARGYVPIAFVVLNDTEKNHSDVIIALREACHNGLADQEQPARIHIISKIPITPSGKVDYIKLENKLVE